METALELLKINLGISHSLRDEYLEKMLLASENELKGRGAAVDKDNTEDLMLLVDYAAWSYKKRFEDVGLSENLKMRIRNKAVEGRANHI